MKILFLPHNAYHTVNLSLVAPYVQRAQAESLFVNVDQAYRGEGAEAEMRKHGLTYMDYQDDILLSQRPDLVVVMNDWGGVIHQRVLEAKKLGIPTVAVVEGVQDFQDTHVAHIGVGRIRRPYQTADHVLLTGDYDKKFFTHERVRVVGVPRIEPLWHEAVRFPEKPLAIINSNFTYGLYTQIQKEWIDDAVAACDQLGIEYVISQHHADEMDLSAYPVAHEHIHDLLRRGSLLISRFSTCLLESMALGKPVIYFNPHDERVDTFQDPMGAYPIAHNRDALVTALSDIIRYRGDYRKDCRKFFCYHVSMTETPSAQRMAEALLEIAHEASQAADAPVESLSISNKKVSERTQGNGKTVAVARPNVAIDQEEASGIPDEARENLAWNARRWGDPEAWIDKDQYGYRWGRGVQQKFNSVVGISEKFLLPYLGNRRDLSVLEIAPGAGRFTTELLRVGHQFYLVDLNKACIDLCRERFKYYPNITYFVNDGVSLSMIPDDSVDLAVSFDSLVHVEPAIIERYVEQLVRKVRPGGLIWLDHSGKGHKDLGHRTEMTDEKMKLFASRFGLLLIAQHYRNDHDCISVLKRPDSTEKAHIPDDSSKCALSSNTSKSKVAKTSVPSAPMPPLQERLSRTFQAVASWHMHWGGMGLIAVLCCLVWYLAGAPGASIAAIMGVVLTFGSLGYVAVRAQAEARDRALSESRRSLAQAMRQIASSRAEARNDLQKLRRQQADDLKRLQDSHHTHHEKTHDLIRKVARDLAGTSGDLQAVREELGRQGEGVQTVREELGRQGEGLQTVREELGRQGEGLQTVRTQVEAHHEEREQQEQVVARVSDGLQAAMANDRALKERVDHHDGTVARVVDDLKEARTEVHVLIKRLDACEKARADQGIQIKQEWTAAVKKTQDIQQSQRAEYMRMRDVKPYQSYLRRLQRQDEDRFLTEWCPKLGVTSSAAHLRYLQQRISFLEDQCLGRMAGHVHDAILRLMVGLSYRRTRIEILEIGTLFGVNAVILYDILSCYGKEVLLTLIDPLEGYYGESIDPGTGLPVSQEILERNLGQAGIPADRRRIIQSFSTQPETLEAISDQQFDYLFIDGDHSYDVVHSDFEQYAKLVRPGGYVLFDDYHNDRWPDVTRAVDEIVRDAKDLEWIGADWETAVCRRIERRSKQSGSGTAKKGKKPRKKKGNIGR